MRQLLILLIAVTTIPAWASDPGEPLDCGDWVFLEPGLFCAQLSTFPCDEVECQPEGMTRQVDNQGRILWITQSNLGKFDCGGSGFVLKRTQVVAFENGQETIIAYIDDRCGANVTADRIEPFPAGAPPTFGRFVFNEEKGSVVVVLQSNCGGGNCSGGSYSEGRWLASVAGLPTTFEILQTYEPTSGPISFRVPYMPEGFQHADFFDTYYGDLATVGDWSKAQPLQCGYPAAAPSVGDYLTVADTTPPLKAGEGRYYVTAVHHMAQTRYGRKSSGGVLAGRDPAVLPGCSE